MNPEIDIFGTKRWHVNGELHRVDGPAIENKNSYKEWWINGKKHRVDGPAIEYSNGTKEWWINGKVIYSVDKNNVNDSTPEIIKKQIIKYELRK